MRLFDVWLRRWDTLYSVVTYIEAIDEAAAQDFCDLVRPVWQLKSLVEVASDKYSGIHVQYDWLDYPVTDFDDICKDFLYSNQGFI